MPSRIKKRQERLVLAHLALTIFRAYHEYVATDNLGDAAELLAVYNAIFIGQAEGRPMNPSKIADFLDIPRTTILRRLARLRELGVVEHMDGVVTLSHERLNAQRTIEKVDSIIRAIHEASAKISKLSKVDSEPVAHR